MSVFQMGSTPPPRKKKRHHPPAWTMQNSKQAYPRWVESSPVLHLSSPFWTDGTAFRESLGFLGSLDEFFETVRPKLTPWKFKGVRMEDWNDVSMPGWTRSRRWHYWFGHYLNRDDEGTFSRKRTRTGRMFLYGEGRGVHTTKMSQFHTSPNPFMLPNLSKVVSTPRRWLWQQQRAVAAVVQQWTAGTRLAELPTEIYDIITRLAGIRIEENSPHSPYFLGR